MDHLSTLGYVDADRIGALGICARAGYAVNATMTDRRIKAVGAVSPIGIGAAYRLGWDGTEPVATQLATLDAVAAQRAAEPRAPMPSSSSATGTEQARQVRRWGWRLE
ncbi:hypothetical protein [Streptomyces sp. NBC_01275]|uniref:hypothetical protein n=1 Tax=Streptomyces sp. NBC_01275 TaxID=2903807 RepID=UPI002B1D49F6|nr:hypothetical protein [Streptomyces sp. NBC_01275]